MDLLRSTTTNHNVKKRRKKQQSPQKGKKKKNSEISKTISKRGFWNADIAEKSKRLWFPKNTKIIPPKSSNGSSIKLVSDSSFRAAIIRAPKKISFTYSLAGTMVKGEPRVKQRGKLPPAVNRCRHYNLALTQQQSAFHVSALRVQQHALMKRMFMDCRKTYA